MRTASRSPCGRQPNFQGPTTQAAYDYQIHAGLDLATVELAVGEPFLGKPVVLNVELRLVQLDASGDDATDAGPAEVWSFGDVNAITQLAIDHGADPNAIVPIDPPYPNAGSGVGVIPLGCVAVLHRRRDPATARSVGFSAPQPDRDRHGGDHTKHADRDTERRCGARLATR